MDAREVYQQELNRRRQMLEHVSPQAAAVIVKQIHTLERRVDDPDSTLRIEDLGKNPGCIFGILQRLFS